MNRKERRAMQKELGLNKFYKNQTLEQKRERMVGNQESGRRMMEEMKERVRVMQNMTAEERESQTISRYAQQIAQNKQIPLIDAMAEAKVEYDKTKK